MSIRDFLCTLRFYKTVLDHLYSLPSWGLTILFQVQLLGFILLMEYKQMLILHKEKKLKILKFWEITNDALLRWMLSPNRCKDQQCVDCLAVNSTDVQLWISLSLSTVFSAEMWQGNLGSWHASKRLQYLKNIWPGASFQQSTCNYYMEAYHT